MKIFHLLVLLILCMSCNGQQPKSAEIKTTDSIPSFKMISIPAIMTDPVKRAEYLVKNYWNNFDFSDTVYVDLPEVTEQAFVDFVDVLSYVPYEVAEEEIKNLMYKAEVNDRMYDYFCKLTENYLHDPNSPMRNEEYFIPVLEAMLTSEKLSDVQRIRPEYLLKVARRNRVGQSANDFTYTLSNGTRGSLYQIKTDYTLLFFYNPECNSCKEIKNQLTSSLMISYLLSEGKLKILAVYPDEDLTAWRNHLAEFPKEWINSYDAGTRIKDEEIYDLKAIPTLYLLDKEKNVILKDTTFEMIDFYFKQLIR